MSNPALWGQATHTLTLIGQQNPNSSHIKQLHDGPISDLVEAIVAGTMPERDEFRKLLGLMPLVLSILVDYGMTLEEMIAAGRYDWVNGDITAKRFPIVGKGKVELKPHLIHFNRVIGSDDVEKELETMGKRPGKIEELLAFGKTYPEVQRKFPILALGSEASIRGDRRVTVLDGGDSRRRLNLDWQGSVWDGYCRFLAFDK